MPDWRGSDRSARLPADWSKRRKKRLAMDGYRCTHRDEYGDRCEEPADEVDHVIPNDNHDYSNLASLCSYHHGKKSGTEGAKAKAIARRRHEKRFKHTETHPGLL